jgi:hypothetical protein
MRRDPSRSVIGRESNVVRVDFSREPDPPAPRFPGASGLRAIGDESAKRDDDIVVETLRTAAAKFC